MVNRQVCLDDYAAMPHNKDLCESSRPEPTSAPFASSCRKRRARKWRQRSWPIPVERPCSGEPEVFASFVGPDRDGESEVGFGTIYFHHAGPEALYMLTAYAKADRDDLTPADRKTLSRLVAAIKKEEASR